MRREREGRRGGTKRGQWRGRCSVVRRIQWGTVFWRCIRSMPRASRAAISSVSIPLHPRLLLNPGKRIHHHHHVCSWLGLGSSTDGDIFDFTCTCREDRFVRGRAVPERKGSTIRGQCFHSSLVFYFVTHAVMKVRAHTCLILLRLIQGIL